MIVTFDQQVLKGTALVDNEWQVRPQKQDIWQWSSCDPRVLSFGEEVGSAAVVLSYLMAEIVFDGFEGRISQLDKYQRLVDRVIEMWCQRVLLSLSESGHTLTVWNSTTTTRPLGATSAVDHSCDVFSRNPVNSDAVVTCEGSCRWSRWGLYLTIVLTIIRLNTTSVLMAVTAQQTRPTALSVHRSVHSLTLSMLCQNSTEQHRTVHSSTDPMLCQSYSNHTNDSNAQVLHKGSTNQSLTSSGSSQTLATCREQYRGVAGRCWLLDSSTLDHSLYCTRLA